jgi:hypothetical protein
VISARWADVRPGATVAVWLLLGVASACGSESPHQAAARSQVVALDWRENCGTREDALPIETRRLAVRRDRWSVELAFRNETSVTLTIVRPHVQGGTYFGLEPFATSARREVVERAERLAAKPRALADRFSPPLPRVLPPGEGWSGSFSGPGSLPARTPIRVVLGRFIVRLGGVPRGFFDGFLCISERVIRLG